MIKRRKTLHNTANVEDRREIASAKEFKERVGSVTDRVNIEGGREMASAKEFKERVGSVTDRVKNVAKSERVKSYMFGAFVAAMSGVSAYQLGMAGRGYGKIQHEETATGISVVSGKPTTEVIGKIDAKRISGYSLSSQGASLSHKLTPNYNLGYSLQLNTNLYIVGAEGKQVLWLQDVINAGKNSKGKEGYANTSEIYAGHAGRSAHMLESRLILSGISGKGSVSRDSYGNQTYVYNQHIKDIKMPMHVALYINVSKGNNEVDVTFGMMPIKDGKLEVKKEVIYDSVRYKVEGLKSASIEFSKINNTGLTISGVWNSMYFYAKQLDAKFSVSEREGGKFVPLRVGGTKDYSTAERVLDVKAVRVSQYEVRVSKD